jgi:hypothetical protein
LWQAFPRLHNFLKFVRRADVLHWHHGALALPFGLDLALVKYLRRPALVKWQGADILVPDVEFADNPYYAAIYDSGVERYLYGTAASVVGCPR